MTDKNKETLKLFNKEVEAIRPYMSIDYNFKKIEPYLTVFDEIPLKEKERFIGYLVPMIWHYNDNKQRGVKKKSITKLQSVINKYQEAIRELHNRDVSDAVKCHNGVDYTYNGEYDFDEDEDGEGFDIELVLYNLSPALKTNYLTNIELLKEIEAFNHDIDLLNEASILYGQKKPTMEFKKYYFEEKLSDYKIINPLDFIEVFRPSKESIKKTFYDIAEEYNINKYEIKQLIDSI